MVDKLKEEWEKHKASKKIKIRFIKDTEQYAEKDIVEVPQSQANEIISQGYAEYLAEDSSATLAHEKLTKEEVFEKLEEIVEEDYLTKEETLNYLVEKSNFTLTTLKKQLGVFEKELKEKERNEKLELEESEKLTAQSLYSRRTQIEAFWKLRPFFYDSSKIFRFWNKEEYKWEMCDEIDFLNGIQKSLNIETIETKTKTELVEGLKQVGRSKKPEMLPKECVQFKNKIYNLKTGEEFEASHKYFCKNPLPWGVGNSTETPTIDRLFKEWVEKEEQLHEACYYSITPHRFMQRIFALVGGGSNGKGTFIKFLLKFLGEDNCVASELKALSEDKFETAVLFGKLVCIMGEVSHDDLKNTNQIKKMAGEDKMSFQFKSKTPFTDDNTAVGMCLTNSLPSTPDKSMGFYRKWHIIDFPNQFQGVKKDLIAEIPEKEFENYALKCLNGLKKLYQTQKFTDEGSFEERMEKYEERSNPVLKFIENYCKDSPEDNIPLRTFTKVCNIYLKKHHLRPLTAIQIGKILRSEGFLVGNRKIDGISSVVILNLKLLELSKLPKVQLESYIETNTDLNSSNSSNSFTPKKDDFSEQNKEILEDFE